MRIAEYLIDRILAFLAAINAFAVFVVLIPQRAVQFVAYLHRLAFLGLETIFCFIGIVIWSLLHPVHSLRSITTAFQTFILELHARCQFRSSTKSLPLQLFEVLSLLFWDYLPPIVQGPRKTLVLDLDETLIKSTLYPMSHRKPDMLVELPDGTFNVYFRPHVHQFLEVMLRWYDVVLFTASLPNYADHIINALDPKNQFKARMYRRHCTLAHSSRPDGAQQPHFVKDLSSVRKNLSKVIILDNSPDAYAFNPSNAIPIKSYVAELDQEQDTALLDLIPFMSALKDVDDVRSLLSLRTYQVGGEIRRTNIVAGSPHPISPPQPRRRQNFTKVAIKRSPRNPNFNKEE